jgi:hypothetical protein
LQKLDDRLLIDCDFVACLMLVLPRALINKYKALAELNGAGKAATPKGAILGL